MLRAALSSYICIEVLTWTVVPSLPSLQMASSNSP